MANRRPRTVDEIFNDFKGRRAGIVRALTVDVEQFYRQCDPNKENLCLFGNPNETWEVKPPVEEVPSAIPEPCLGINFARDVMLRKDWLSLVAAHSDSWLISLVVYFGSQYGFGKRNRGRLFRMVNEFPTVREVVRQPPPQQPERKEEEEEEGTTYCGDCGGKYSGDEFWICCDVCQGWYHGKCVKITPTLFERIMQFKCATCSK